MQSEISPALQNEKLRLLPMVVTKTEVENNRDFTIRGYRFGKETGNLTYYVDLLGKAISAEVAIGTDQISYWSDTVISFSLTQEQYNESMRVRRIAGSGALHFGRVVRKEDAHRTEYFAN